MASPVAQWLTIAEVAQRLGLSTRTVRQMITDRRIPAARINSRVIRVSSDDLQRYLNRHTVPSVSCPANAARAARRPG